jgi:hypothetical protein
MSAAQEQAQAALNRYRRESQNGAVTISCAAQLAAALEAVLYDKNAITL